MRLAAHPIRAGLAERRAGEIAEVALHSSLAAADERAHLISVVARLLQPAATPRIVPDLPHASAMALHYRTGVAAASAWRLTPGSKAGRALALM